MLFLFILLSSLIFSQEALDSLNSEPALKVDTISINNKYHKTIFVSICNEFMFFYIKY